MASGYRKIYLTVESITCSEALAVSYVNHPVEVKENIVVVKLNRLLSYEAQV